jgi:hypothetical protein
VEQDLFTFSEHMSSLPSPFLVEFNLQFSV